MLGFHAFNSLRHTHTHTHKRKASALKQPLATVIDEKCSSRIESCRDTAPFSNGSIPPRSTRCLLLFCRVLFCFGPIQFLLVATWSHYCSGFHLVLGRDPSPGTTHQLGSPALLDCSDVTSNGTEKRNSINLEISGSPFRTHLGSNRIAAEQVTFWFCKSKSRPYSTEKKRPSTLCQVLHYAPVSGKKDLFLPDCFDSAMVSLVSERRKQQQQRWRAISVAERNSLS